jgi:hypothetical protein
VSSTDHCQQIAARRGPRSSFRAKCKIYSAASAAGFLNWAVSVEAPMAVVEAVPPVTATVTASKEPVC